MVAETLLSSWRVLLLALDPLPPSEERTEQVAGHCQFHSSNKPTFQVTTQITYHACILYTHCLHGVTVLTLTIQHSAQSVAILPFLPMELLPCRKHLEVWKWCTLASQTEP